MTTIQRSRPGGLRERMLDDHVRLATLCNQVVETFDHGDRDACDAAYRELERRLEDHLGFEERELFPSLARIDPGEAAALAEEHRHLRARVAELGIGVDLHATRAAAVKALAIELGEHARREGMLLYRWAEESFDEPMRTHWLTTLRAIA